MAAFAPIPMQPTGADVLGQGVTDIFKNLPSYTLLPYQTQLLKAQAMQAQMAANQSQILNSFLNTKRMQAAGMPQQQQPIGMPQTNSPQPGSPLNPSAPSGALHTFMQSIFGGTSSPDAAMPGTQMNPQAPSGAVSPMTGSVPNPNAGSMTRQQLVAQANQSQRASDAANYPGQPSPIQNTDQQNAQHFMDNYTASKLGMKPIPVKIDGKIGYIDQLTGQPVVSQVGPTTQQQADIKAGQQTSVAQNKKNISTADTLDTAGTHLATSLKSAYELRDLIKSHPNMGGPVQNWFYEHGVSNDENAGKFAALTKTMQGEMSQYFTARPGAASLKWTEGGKPAYGNQAPVNLGLVNAAIERIQNEYHNTNLQKVAKSGKPITVPLPPDPSQQDPIDAYAQDAIARGADRNKVMARVAQIRSKK